jgi:hypothetical protein
LRLDIDYKNREGDITTQIILNLLKLKNIYYCLYKRIIDMANKTQKYFKSLGHHELLDIVKTKDKIEKFRYIFNHNFANFELEKDWL